MEWHLDKNILDFGLTDTGTIVIDWNNGRRSVFDPHPYMTGTMAKLLDPDYLKTAFVTGHGRSIAWPGNLDFGTALLYEESVTEDSGAPLPPRGSRMRWSPTVVALRLKLVEGGKIAIDWSDGTVRQFDAWDHADNDVIEKLADPAYFAQARITPDRDAVAWPDGERFDAKILYERSAIMEG